MALFILHHYTGFTTRRVLTCFAVERRLGDPGRQHAHVLMVDLSMLSSRALRGGRHQMKAAT